MNERGKLAPHEQKKQREDARKRAEWNRWQRGVMEDWQWYRHLPKELKERK